MKSLATTLILLCAAACSPMVHSAEYADLRPTPPAQDLQFYDTARPQCGYDEVGTISVRKRLGTVGADDVKQTLKVRARDMGGDGVIALCNDHDKLDQPGDRLSLKESEQEVTGTVIKFRNRSCMY